MSEDCLISLRANEFTSVRRSRGTDLRLLDNVRVHAPDLLIGFRGNIAITVVVTRGVDLLVSQVGQVGRSESLGRTVSMSVEHVHTEHRLGRHRRREKGEGSERLGQHFCTERVVGWTKRRKVKRRANGSYLWKSEIRWLSAIEAIPVDAGSQPQHVMGKKDDR